MKGLIWNCRGFNDPLAPTIGRLRALLSKNSYDFVFLSETKCDSSVVSPICRPFGFMLSDGVDAIGSSGGLWVGWKQGTRFSILSKCPNFIIIKVSQCYGSLWYLCLIYGAPAVCDRERVWTELGHHLYSLDAPFLLLGDFNQVEYSWEKLSKNVNHIQGADIFHKWKLNHELIDIPFKGPIFTWCNNRDGDDRVYERLDKAYGSKDWLSLFPNSGLLHYPIQLSDHAPVDFDLCLTKKKKCRPYKLEAWCLSDEDASKVIADSWRNYFIGSPGFVVMRKLAHVRYKAMKWCLERRKQWNEKWSNFDHNLSQELDGIFSGKGHEEYDRCHGELKKFAEAAAIYWRQRAKLKWQIDGDTCTKYFFNWVKGRAGRNYVLGIKDSNKNWIFDEKDVGETFRTFFFSLYNPDSPVLSFARFENRHQKTFDALKTRLREDDVRILNRPFTAKEVRGAVFQLGPLKSPGPDGIPATPSIPIYTSPPFWHKN